MIQNKFLFLTDIEIYKKRVKQQDVKDCTYDAIRMGYWIKANSPAHTLLILKNVTFKNYRNDIRF